MITQEKKEELRNMLKNAIFALNANDYVACKRFIDDANKYMNIINGDK